MKLSTANSSTATGQLAAHEFGHTLGNLPHVGNASLLMAPHPGQGVTRGEMDEVIKACENGPKPGPDSSTSKGDDKQ